MDDMKNAGLYIHGKGGSAAECKHYKPLFPDCEVFGLDYRTFTLWETGAEIHAAVEKLKTEYEKIILIANSIGAFFQHERRDRQSDPKGVFYFPRRRYGKTDRRYDAMGKCDGGGTEIQRRDPH